MTYDLVIIGGGPAGYHAASLAGKAGLSVALFEKKAIGGVCLHEGCIPAKTLLQSARVLSNARQAGRYGVTAENPRLDHAQVLERKRKVVKTLQLGILAELRQAGVTVISAPARFVGRDERGFAVNANGELWYGKRALVATGSETILPRLPGLDEGLTARRIVTSRELLDRTSVPESLVVVGAGAVGLEFASYFLSAGSRVTVVEMLDRIGGLDGEAADFFQKSLARRGIDFRLRTKLIGFTDAGARVAGAGGEETLAAETVLVSVGRRPVAGDLGLETVGLYSGAAAIATDESGRTAVPDLFAAGDVNGRSLFAHTAYREAEAVAEVILGREAPVPYGSVPEVVYTDPEAASAGLSPAACDRRSVACRSASVPLRSSGRFLIENEGGDGLFVMTATGADGRLLGVQAVGNGASEIVFGATLMLERGMRVEEIARTVFPHPTVSEIYREAARRIL